MNIENRLSPRLSKAVTMRLALGLLLAAATAIPSYGTEPAARPRFRNSVPRARLVQ